MKNKLEKKLKIEYLKKSKLMNFQVEKEDIYPILSQIQSLLEKRSALPVFTNILISSKDSKNLQIYASDSELSFSSVFPGIVKKEGSIVINGKKLFEIVREFSSEVFEFHSEENYKIKIHQNQSVFKIHGLNPEDFPKFPELKKKTLQKLPVDDFLEVVDKTLYCVSLDESRYHLTGVFLENRDSNYRFVATDGHRLSYIDIPGEKNEELNSGIIIPKKGLQELKKMLFSAEKGEIFEMTIEKPRLFVKFKNQSLNIRLIEGEYPNYKKLLPEDKGKKITLLTMDFLSALKRISVLTSARFKGVNFHFKKRNLMIRFSHPEMGEAFEEISCEYEGDEITVKFNSKYILDILQSIDDEKINLFFKDAKSPGIIQSESTDKYTCLVMPMKI